MRTTFSIFDTFARLFSYPDDRYKSTLVEMREIIADESLHFSESVSDNLQTFLDAVAALPIEEMEELYTRTFDINPVASLEIGWHLYGEQYERGAFLVKMRDVLRRYQIEEVVELPDHMTHVLLAFGRMEKAEADEYAVKYLIPAIDKILEGFKDQKNPYEYVLQSIRSFIEHQHVAGVTTNE